MSLIKHIKRWTFASYIKNIKARLEQGFDLFVEGDDRLTAKLPKHFELRMDGPYITPCGTKGEYRAYIEVNLLGNSTRNESNRYERQNLQGLLQNYLNQDFCVYRTGNQNLVPEIDDGSFFEVFKLITVDQIKVSDFGMIDPSTTVYQCVAEAHYELFFTDTE